MKKLAEMVQVLDRRRLKKIEIFNDSGSKSSVDNLYYKFYHGIREGKFKSDEEAARILCNTTPSDKKYLMLKSRLRTRLMNSLFFLEASPTRYQQALAACQRDLYSAHILLLHGANDSAVSILKSAYQEAEKFSIVEVAMDCCRELKRHYAYLGDKSEYEYYDLRFHDLKSLLDAELFSETIIQKIVVSHARSSSHKPGMATEARAALAQLDEMIGDRIYTRSLKLNTLRIRLLIHQLEGNHLATLGVAQEGENYLLQRPHLSQNMRLGEFAMHQMVACLHLRDYKNGEANAMRCIQYLKEGSYNWMIFLEYFFLLCMHTGQYDRAVEVYKQVTSHPRFAILDEARLEKWRIFEAFLTYAKEDNASEDAAQRKFNLYKFLNEVPIYSKDKRGRNISILILQVLYLLDRQDWSAIMGRTESLKVYASRHLKKDETFRSNCFVKMMLTMEKKDFDRDETERLASKYLSKLTSSRFDYRGDLTNLEVIPYEMLWQKILSRLKTAA